MKLTLSYIFVFLQLVSFSQDQDEIDSLSAIAESNVHDTIRVNALRKWDFLIYISDPQLDNELNLQIAEICERNLKQADDLSDEEVFYYKEKLANAYNILGINADDAGDYPLAMDFYYKSRWIAEDIGDMETVGGLYNNIGLIHEKLGDLELALEFYRKSLKLVDQLDDHGGVVNALSNIGSVYLAKNDPERALDYYRRSLHTAERNGLGYLASMTTGNIGVAFERLDILDSALFYYEKGKLEMAAMGDWDGLSNVNYNIGMIHIMQEEWKKAIKVCREGLNIALRNEGKYRQALNCDCLYFGFDGLGRSDSALHYYIIRDSLEMTFENKETTREIAKKEIAYLSEKKSFEDSLQFANEMTIKNAESDKKEAEFRLMLTSLLGGLGFLALLGIFIYTRLNITKKQKKAIEEQAEITRKQKEIIAEQKHEIDQSIDYAKLIQQATLPTKSYSDIFVDSFLIYLPKDVVSGDFYWLEEDDTHKYFAVADCTGHGIPGAFISMIGTILLNEIHNSKNIRKPDLVLNELNRLIQLTLATKDLEMKDGMDISFCSLDKNTNVLSYAGANNPAWIISENDTITTVGGETVQADLSEGYHIFQLNADKQPVGKYHDDQKPFTVHQVQLNKGDQVYLFSDGFPDQFGGPKWKKFKYKPFKRLLLENRDKSLAEQKSAVIKAFEDWKGDYEQIDDICIMGVRV